MGWICALPLELSAALEMLDEEHEELHIHSLPYTLGRIGLHNVIVACLPAGQMGTNSAAGVASQMMSDFKSIHFGFLVGIGGGVPNSTTDIRLGDVVISQPHLQYPGVVQYDFGKTEEGGKSSRIGSLNSPPAILLTSVSKLTADARRGRNGITKHLQKSDLSPTPTRQSPGDDVLFEAAYAHAGGSSCIACDRNRVVQRTPRENQSPMIHCGTIASGNQVMKDGVTRGKLSANLGGGILCFEMEAAGIMNSFPCLVIRGICDYADSHKNKGWQVYASAAVAACAKEFLYITPGVESVGKTSRGSSNERLVYSQELSIHMEPSTEISTSPNGMKSSSVSVDQRRQVLTQSLSFAEIDVRHTNIQNAYTETCKWLLDQPEYQDWRDPSKLSEHYGFFWLKGKPGAGKSTMMKFAYANAIKTMTDTTILCFFFNARGISLEKSVEGLYRSLLSQLLDKLPDLQSILDTLSIEASSASVSSLWTAEILQKLFQCAIEKLGEFDMLYRRVR